MSEYVAVDAKPVNLGGDVLLLGAAVDVKDGDKFCQYYFNKVEEFCQEIGINKPFNLVKNSEIKKSIPSYELSEKRKEFFRKIVSNPHVDNLHISIGWYNDTFSPSYSNQTLSPTDLINEHLKPHFEIITLWQYYVHHSEKKPKRKMPDVAYCDESGGKVTKAWKYCGKKFDSINMVPHGDLTYPAISTADLIVGSLGDYLPDNRSYQDCETIARQFLIDELDDDVFSIFEPINENSQYADHLVPQLRFPIKNSIHYPHPIVFIYDDIFEENSNLFSMATELTHDEGGCAKNISQPDFPNSVEEGDYVVYAGDDDGIVNAIESSFPHIDTNMLSIPEFSELYQDRYS